MEFVSGLNLRKLGKRTDESKGSPRSRQTEQKSPQDLLRGKAGSKKSRVHVCPTLASPSPILRHRVGIDCRRARTIRKLLSKGSRWQWRMSQANPFRTA